MSPLHDCLARVEQLLEHCRQHLQPDEWKIFTRRLVGTPFEQGTSAQEHWTAAMMIAYYWPRLSEAEQATFLRKQQRARQRHKKEMPCS